MACGRVARHAAYLAAVPTPPPPNPPSTGNAYAQAAKGTTPATKYANFYEALQADPSHKLMVLMIKQGGYDRLLSMPTLKYTVFAPTDAVRRQG